MTAAEVDGYPAIDGDECDMSLYRLQTRVQALVVLAQAELESDPRCHFARAVEALDDDWRRFRHELAHAVRESSRAGFVERTAGEK